LADDLRVCAKAALPKALAYECYSAAAKAVLVSLKSAAKHGFDAKHREQIGGGHQTGHTLRSVSSGEAKTLFAIRRNVFEDLILISPIQEVAAAIFPCSVSEGCSKTRTIRSNQGRKRMNRTH
jgi:hypothetical protein